MSKPHRPRPPWLALPTLVALACTPAPERAGPAADDSGVRASTAAQPEPAAAADPTGGPRERPASPDARDYAPFGMPTPGPWSVDEYSSAYKAVSAIAKQDPALLPRAGSATFVALTDVPHLAQLASKIPPEQLAGLSLSLGMIHMVYNDQRRRDSDWEREWLVVTAAVLAVTTKLPTSVVTSVAEAEALRSTPSRLKGMLRYRHGVYEMVDDLASFTAKSSVSYAFACTQLAAVIDDAAPLLLADERASVRAQLEACAAAGAEPSVVAQLQAALADEAPTAPLVTALLPEHLDFAAAP